MTVWDGNAGESLDDPVTHADDRGQKATGWAAGSQVIYLDEVRRSAECYRRGPDRLSEAEVRTNVLGSASGAWRSAPLRPTMAASNSFVVELERRAAIRNKRIRPFEQRRCRLLCRMRMFVSCCAASAI